MAAPPSNIFPENTPTGSFAVKPTGQANYTPSHQNGVQGNVVQKMQQALIDLYETLSNATIKEWFAGEDEPEEHDDQFRKGPAPFLKFMLNNYIDKSKINAKQYDLSLPDAKMYAAPNQQVPKSSFVQYLEMLKTVGSHTSKQNAQLPDGKWGDFTNNAIKAAWSIASAMVSITIKLGDKFSISQQDLNKFASLIPKNDQGKTPINAEKITQYINKIKLAANDFVHIMLESNSKYSDYTTQDKKFDVFSGAKSPSADELSKANEMRNQNVPGLVAPFTNLQFITISNLRNFTAWLNTVIPAGSEMDKSVIAQNSELYKNAIQEYGEQSGRLQFYVNLLKSQLTAALEKVNSESAK